ncbi:MAG: DNA repair and recombination protein RadA [archaeon]|nr:DNA repair and recombination protein RadA [archaeon]
MDQRQRSQDDEEQGEQNEDSKSFDPIEVLQEHGISANDIKKLTDNGYYSVQSVLFTIKKNLTNIKGLADAKVDKIINACNEVCHMGFMPCEGFLKQREALVKITTGSNELDRALGGGIETCSITEMYGEFRTGKTQLCHTLAITAQIKTENGSGGKVLYIDTEGTFRPEKLRGIAERFELDPDEAIGNIMYARAYSSEHQNKLLIQACALMAQNKFAILIVDSATALFRTDYTGRGQLAERQMSLGKFLRNLQRLADEFKVAVVITNQVVSNPDGSSAFAANEKQPIGGNIMAHASQTRLYLKKGQKDTRRCKIVDSPSCAEQEVSFKITETGITDA